jgi:hypothetical protein
MDIFLRDITSNTIKVVGPILTIDLNLALDDALLVVWLSSCQKLQERGLASTRRAKQKQHHFWLVAVYSQASRQ